MRTRRPPRGILSLPGVESPDDFRLVLIRVHATSLPPPPVKGLAWADYDEADQDAHEARVQELCATNPNM